MAFPRTEQIAPFRILFEPNSIRSECSVPLSDRRRTPGLGRYVPRIRDVAEAAELNVIVATGVHAFLELPNFIAYRSTG